MVSSAQRSKHLGKLAGREGWSEWQAPLRNALRVVGKQLSDCRVVVCGVGAAGTAIIRLLESSKPGDVLAVDVGGIVHPGRPGLDDNLAWVAGHTNASEVSGTLADALVGADVFIGVSAPNLFGEAELATMADRAIVFALANPDPEVDPGLAARHAAIVATGRSDYPNQINNVLAFPGIFRGLLDAQARDITDAMLPTTGGRGRSACRASAPNGMASAPVREVSRKRRRSITAQKIRGGVTMDVMPRVRVSRGSLGVQASGGRAESPAD